jgi:hypothetical protein
MRPNPTTRAIEWDEDFKRAALAVGGDQSGAADFCVAP